MKYITIIAALAIFLGTTDIQAQDYVSIGDKFEAMGEVSDATPFTRPMTVTIPGPRNKSRSYTPRTLNNNTSSWLDEKMDDPLFKKDSSAESELRRYIAPFFDYIETELGFDSEDLKRVQITNNYGREILTFDDLTNGGTALMILPKGNYNVEFVFGTDVHNTILIKK